MTTNLNGYSLLLCSVVPGSSTKTHCQLAVEAIPQPVPIGRYVPQCDETGEYNPRQVHGSTGYSWCVDRQGNEIPGTRTPPYDPSPVCTPHEGVAALLFASTSPRKILVFFTGIASNLLLNSREQTEKILVK